MFTKRKGNSDASQPKKRRVHSEDNASEREQPHCSGGDGDATGLQEVRVGKSTLKTMDGNKKGLHDPKEEEKPLYADRIQIGISERIGKGLVLVDSFVKMPQRVYFVQSDSKYEDIDTEDYFRLQMYHDPPMQGPDRLFILPRDSSEKTKKKTDSTLEAVALSLFENLASFIRYHPRENSWIIKENASDSYYDYLWELVSKSAVLAECCRQGALPVAFRNRMTNAMGKRALSAILEMASIVAFGPEVHVRAQVTCITVGSAGRSGKLPVAETPSDFYHKTGKKWKLRSRSAQSDRSVGTSDEDLETASGSDAALKMDNTISPSVSTTSSRIEIPTTGVYPDLVLLSGFDPNWPHYMFMGELKCGRMTTDWEWEEEEECGTGDSLSSRARAQLVREMLAAMLTQNVVFGIGMNHRDASLYSMKLNFEERIIGVYCRDYQLVNADYTFSYDAMRCMFLDIVSVLKDMKCNLKEVCHWPKTDC